MIPAWQNATCIKVQQEASNTRRFWLQLSDTDNFEFKAGQFVTLDLPIHEKKNKRWRSYSIASSPDGSNVIELVIVRLEDGAGSGYFFDEVKEGSVLTLRGPHGMFTLPQVLDGDLFLVCTGTGIAPYRSMLRHLLLHPQPYKNIHLIMGTRKKEDLLYHEEMLELAQNLPRFHYHPTLSREDWEGRKGYVHEIYEELCANNPNAQFMLCGWRNMVDEARTRLAALGYDRKAVHLELYG